MLRKSKFSSKEYKQLTKVNEPVKSDTTLEIGTKISRIMNLDFLEHQKMLYSFLKKEHFVPSVQRDNFASGVNNLVI